MALIRSCSISSQPCLGHVEPLSSQARAQVPSLSVMPLWRVFAVTQKNGTVHREEAPRSVLMLLIRLLPSAARLLLSLLKWLPWDKFIFPIIWEVIPGLYLPSCPPAFPRGSAKCYWTSLCHHLLVLLSSLEFLGTQGTPSPHPSVSLPIRVSGLSFPKPSLCS